VIHTVGDVPKSSSRSWGNLNEKIMEGNTPEMRPSLEALSSHHILRGQWCTRESSIRLGRLDDALGKNEDTFKIE
jgi:hypothetical protein